MSQEFTETSKDDIKLIKEMIDVVLAMAGLPRGFGDGACKPNKNLIEGKFLLKIDLDYQRYKHTLDVSETNSQIFVFLCQETHILKEMLNQIWWFNKRKTQANLEKIQHADAWMCIEFPEKLEHPSKQKEIMDEYLHKVNRPERVINGGTAHLFLCTHSPYILSSLNNAIVGYDALQKIKTNAQREEWDKYFTVNTVFPFENVHVFDLVNGEFKKIMHEDNRLIDTNILDEVLTDFADAFDCACEIIYRDE